VINSDLKKNSMKFAISFSIKITWDKELKFVWPLSLDLRGLDRFYNEFASIGTYNDIKSTMKVSKVHTLKK
jgi:hypothetical protein